MENRGWAAHKRDNLALARAFVNQHAPYFGPTLYGLVPFPKPGLTAIAGGPMAVTERLVLLYDPEWVQNETVEVLAFGLAHECMHDLLRHVARGKSYLDKERWNKAGDLFINGSMAKQERTVNRNRTYSKEKLWTIPDWVALPSRFGFPEGLSADEYYQLLEDHKKHDEPCKIFSGCCGGVAGNPSKGELEALPEVLAKGRPEAECRAIARETARALQKHMEGAGRGTTPGEWSDLVDIGEERFHIPWRQKLANILRHSVGAARTGGLDYSRRRPSKRSYLRGIQLPSLISFDPTIFFIVDSSGSMGLTQLSDSLRVCADVLKQTGVSKAWFLEADTQPARNQPLNITPTKLRSLEIKGRGGTDFTAAIKFAEEFRPRPSVVFYLTDGDGAAPEQPPQGMHFVWCIVPSYYNKAPATWGDIVVLSDDAEELEHFDNK